MTNKILSVFIDESGDFGPYDSHAPYYLVSMVLHNQSISLSENIANFDRHLTNLGYPNHAIHTGPLIRRESIYSHDLNYKYRRQLRSQTQLPAVFSRPYIYNINLIITSTPPIRRRIPPIRYTFVFCS